MIWLVGHGALLTNVDRMKRHLVGDPSCLRCGSPFENSRHYLKECPKAKHIWEWLRLWRTQFFYEDDIMTWIKKGVASSSHFFSCKPLVDLACSLQGLHLARTLARMGSF